MDTMGTPFTILRRIALTERRTVPGNTPRGRPRPASAIARRPVARPAAEHKQRPEPDQEACLEPLQARCHWRYEGFDGNEQPQQAGNDAHDQARRSHCLRGVGDGRCGNGTAAGLA